jgi:hypothetical protein
MPSGFPSAAHDGVTKCVSTRSKTHQAEYREFAAGWSAVAHRYFACCESDRAFTKSIERGGPAPAPPERYLQEHALYVFFASGLSTIESFAYAMHAIGWMLDPPRFDMSSEGQKRNVKPLSTCERFEAAFPNEALPAALREVIGSDEYDEWSGIRNALSHRAAPGRAFSITIGVPDEDRAAEWRWGAIDERTTADRFEWLTSVTSSLVEAANEFAQTPFA